MLRPLFALLVLTAQAHAATCGGPSGQDPQSTTGSFGAGSLIIPMDTCYNPDSPRNAGPTNTGGACGGLPAYASPSGANCYNNASLANVRHPFGMLYLFLESGIPVNVILNNAKA